MNWGNRIIWFCFTVEHKPASVKIQVYKDIDPLRPQNGSEGDIWGGWRPSVTISLFSIWAAMMWERLWSASWRMDLHGSVTLDLSWVPLFTLNSILWKTQRKFFFAKPLKNTPEKGVQASLKGSSMTWKSAFILYCLEIKMGDAAIAISLLILTWTKDAV